MNFIGSEQVETSVANQEILPNPPSNWTVPYALTQFSFQNDQECTLIINGKDKVFLREGQGFTTGFQKAKIQSVKILEDGIAYNWVGAY